MPPTFHHLRALYRAKRHSKEMTGESRRCRCQFGLKCKFLFLTVLVVAYVVGGAWVFALIENPNQERQEADIQVTKERLLSNLTSLLDPNRENATIEMIIRVDEFEALLFKKFKSGGTPSGKSVPWDWTSGCFFCMTVLTTIGYGTMVPVTQTGKIVCIFYAIFGIPLFLIFLAKLGDILVNAIRKCHRTCCKRKSKKGPGMTMKYMSGKGQKHHNSAADDEYENENADIPISPFIVVYTIYLFAGAGIFYYTQDSWEFVDAIYFIICTFTTIGFGDMVPAYGDGSSGGISTITDLTKDLAKNLEFTQDLNLNISSRDMEAIRHADFALLIWYIIIGMVIMSCIFNLLLVKLRKLSHVLSTKKHSRRDRFALNSDTFYDGPTKKGSNQHEGEIRKVELC